MSASKIIHKVIHEFFISCKSFYISFGTTLITTTWAPITYALNMNMKIRFISSTVGFFQWTFFFTILPVLDSQARMCYLHWILWVRVTVASNLNNLHTDVTSRCGHLYAKMDIILVKSTLNLVVKIRESPSSPTLR